MSIKTQSCLLLQFIFSILIFSSCNTKVKTNDEKNTAKLAVAKSSSLDKFIVKTVNFKLDETTPAKSSYIQFIEETNSLAFMNPTMNTINIYNLDSSELSKKIILERDGPNGVGQVRSFIIKGDKLFVLNSDAYKFYQLDSSGKVLETYNLATKNGSKAKASTRQPIIIEWPYAILCSTPYRSLSSTELYEAQDLLTILNLETKEIEYFLPYPEEVKGKLWGSNLSDKFYTYNQEKKEIVISWPPTSKITVSDLTSIKYYDLPSKHNIQTRPVETMPSDYKASHEIYTKNPQYFYIFHDKFRSLYYRMVAKAVPEKFLNSNNFDESNLKPFSIMVVDEGFRVLDEIDFPHLKYYNYMTFINKEGLWMARIPENEDELIFDCFKLK